MFVQILRLAAPIVMADKLVSGRGLPFCHIPHSH